MTEHTPGPWHVSRDRQPIPPLSAPGISVWAPNAEPSLHRYEDDQFICGIWGVPEKMDEANARLIAAAPEMFDLLGKVFTTAEVHGKVDRGTDLHQQIGDLLEKATNTTP